MTKNITTICCAVALLATTAATPALSQSKLFEGISLAINGSLNGSASNYKDRWSMGEIPIGEYDDKLGDVSTVFGSDLNYGFSLSNNFILGVGITYDFGKTKAGNTSLSYRGEDDEFVLVDGLKASIEDHKSIYIQPTYIVSSTTGLFAKLGYHDADYKLTHVGYGVSDSANLKGWGYGFGVKTFINNNLFIQAEAQQINYGSESYTYAEGSSTITVKPKVYSGTISIGYKF